MQGFYLATDSEGRIYTVAVLCPSCGADLCGFTSCDSCGWDAYNHAEQTYRQLEQTREEAA